MFPVGFNTLQPKDAISGLLDGAQGRTDTNGLGVMHS